ncbi:MAG: hypothetical protein QNL05_08135 [Gammaproteobacteria bacterium]|nr:hypothetical protein [Gammaproteobacteria bacterium]MDX2487534.1 hypothetical protein [Gammaproteobacteria bacterium]
MPGSINILSSTAEAMRQLYRTAYNPLLKLTSDTDMPSVLEYGQAMEQMYIVDYPDHVRDILQQYHDLWGDECASH